MTETFTWQPTQEGAGRNKAYHANAAQFGDGYSQRSPAGINNSDEAWQLQFYGDETTVAEIEAFLDARGGHESFYWTPPRGTQKRFVCGGFRSTPLDDDGWATVHVTFQQVFVP